MTIIYPIDDFLFELFASPDSAKKDTEALKQRLKAYYSNIGVNAEVTIRDKLAIVEITERQNNDSEKPFEQAVALCNRHEFDAAKDALFKFIKDSPAHSEAHRLLGQIYSEEGDQEKAQDELIEALRLNPKNDSALIMMGNILSNYRRDALSAQKYFEQANQVKPNNHIILNNLGGNSLKLNQLAKAKDYLTQALQVNHQYANTHYALAIVAEKEDDLQSCFYSAVNAVKYSGGNISLREQAQKLCFEICVPIVRNSQGASESIADIAKDLQNTFRVSIEFVADVGIELPAILELAENHNRNKHIIRYKESDVTHEYWKLHALIMLRLILAARSAGKNQRFATTQATKDAFLRSVEENKRHLAAEGLDSARIERIMDAVYHGVVQLIYNTCIDLFVEDEIHQNYAEFRPYQFVSMHGNLRGSIESITNENVVRNSPKSILSVTRVYSMVKALHFRDLYGVDYLTDLKPSDSELKQANAMYNEFTEYRGDTQAGDEYKVLQNWAKTLGIDGFFELVNDLTGNSTAANASAKDSDAEMQKFQQKAAAMGLNMAVVMFMGDALDYFSGKDSQTIKKIAMEIAMLGMNGIRPEQQGYKVKSIEAKTFSGYHLLAYYYVSFALVLPEMLKELKLPYDQEYNLAQQMVAK